MATVTPARALTWRKIGSGHALYLRDRGRALATVEPDSKYPGMWRVHMPDGWVSDMANLPWAKEGAIRSVLSFLNRKETASEGVPVRLRRRGAPNTLSAVTERA